MTDRSDDADIRLLDFGLGKIIGPNETCKDPFGTLSYVAPEILLEEPYNTKVDLWAIGIITYLLLAGFLPFDSDVSEKEIARQTVYEPTPFPSVVWNKVSLEAKMFVENLLNKNMLTKSVKGEYRAMIYNKTGNIEYVPDRFNNDYTSSCINNDYTLSSRIERSFSNSMY